MDAMPNIATLPLDDQVCDLYLRLSDLRAGDIDTFEDRLEKLRKKLAELGLTEGEVIIENDWTRRKDGTRGSASAFKTRKVVTPNGETIHQVIRPGFDRILKRLAARASHAILAEDLDRVVRNPYDGERLLSTVKQNRASAYSITGTLRLTNGGTSDEQFIARTLINVAWKASEDTARRVREARERQAKNGRFGGGRRPFGFDKDGVTPRVDECLVIETASRMVLQGISLRAIARELRSGEVPTVTGTPWSPETLKDILIRPRNAGKMVYQGEVIGDAPWSPIVRWEVFEQVRRILCDPERKSVNTGEGPARKYVGSGVYLCGKCNDGTTTNVTACTKRGQRYKCSKHAHLTRNQQHVDTYVKGVVAELLTDGALAEMLSTDDVNVDALREERTIIEATLKTLAHDHYTLKIIDRATFLQENESNQRQLEKINRQLTQAVAEDTCLAAVVKASSPAAAFLAAPLAVQQAVVRELVTVTIVPPGRQGKGFDPDGVRIERRKRDQEPTTVTQGAELPHAA